MFWTPAKSMTAFWVATYHLSTRDQRGGDLIA